jgi:oligogalacturonide transport system permease protein
MDGCGFFLILRSILLPLLKPAVFSAAILQSMWTWDDFFQALSCISSVDKDPVTLDLRLSIAAIGIPPWDQITAMSVLSILPSVAMLFAAQRHLVEGIATTGLKG